MKESQISIVVPVYNESENIKPLYLRLEPVLRALNKDYRIVFVNDGSDDDSFSKIIELSKDDNNVFFINLSRNFGHQIAISAGLSYCNSDCVVIIDSDLQDPPELIKKLYEKYKEGYDVVYAQRRKRKGESFIKKITAKIFYRLLKRMVNFEIPLDTGDYRLMTKKVVEAINKMPEQNKFLRAQIAWLGFSHTSVLYDRDMRNQGDSGYTYSKMFKLAFDGITGFSDKPLLFVSRLGFLISVFSFLVILYAIFSHFVLEKTITGWTSLIICITFIGGIQLLSIGVIGEYISRISSNVRNRPLYIIDSTNISIKKKNSR